ncbi:MAG: hypothetical protein JO203_03330 [Gammaproteobacteria bacterium]|nr:hypothetical protein [Gammaproteobacteria bacterium]
MKLAAPSDIAFLQPPGGKRGENGAYAGLARLTVDSAGPYRISLDESLWVDVIVGGTPVPAKDFQGRPGCHAPHKIVEFVLPAGVPITLQFSGGRVPQVKVSVTRSRDGPP